MSTLPEQVWDCLGIESECSLIAEPALSFPSSVLLRQLDCRLACWIRRGLLQHWWWHNYSNPSVSNPKHFSLSCLRSTADTCFISCGIQDGEQQQRSPVSVLSTVFHTATVHRISSSAQLHQSHRTKPHAWKRTQKRTSQTLVFSCR
jgi:hypothetical protein